MLFLQYSRLMFNFFTSLFFPVWVYFISLIQILHVQVLYVENRTGCMISCSSHKLYRPVKTGGGQGGQPTPTLLQSSNFCQFYEFVPITILQQDKGFYNYNCTSNVSITLIKQMFLTITLGSQTIEMQVCLNHRRKKIHSKILKISICFLFVTYVNVNITLIEGLFLLSTYLVLE